MSTLAENALNAQTPFDHPPDVLKILVIEDNPGDFDLIRESLIDVQGLGLELVNADTLAGGIEKLQREKYDLVLLDLSLPDSQGLETVRSALKQAPGVPMIILSGLKDYETAISAIRLGAQDYLIKGLIDRYILERAIQYAIERFEMVKSLEELNRIKDKLLSIVSHDLKNPIGIILSGSKLLLAQYGKNLPGDFWEMISSFQKHADYSIHLINDLLTMGRVEGGMKLALVKFKTLEILARAKETVEFQLRQKNIKLIVVSEYNYEIQADFYRVLQVLINVLANAIKYSPAGSTITIRAGLAAIPAGSPAEKQLQFEISDQGTGIPEPLLEKIFDEYVQASAEDKERGFGLGLAICREICKMHNGRIWAESKSGQGATFFILLPIDADLPKISGLNPEKHLMG